MELRVRRGQREDIRAIERVLGSGHMPLEARLMRRLVEDVTSDLFVAFDAMGDVIGVLAIGYRRSLAYGGQVATVDTLALSGVVEGLRSALLTFAETRARGRGCRAIVVSVGVARAADGGELLARGYEVKEGGVRWLGEESR